MIARTLEPHQARLSQLSDGLAVAVAASIPWSTSATSILVGLWLIVFLPTLDLAKLRLMVKTPAAAFVLLLIALALLGILWSDAGQALAFRGFSPFAKLFVLPLLLIHFRQSERGMWVFGAFLISCSLLLVVSFITVVWTKPFGFKMKSEGIPVKDRIAQSGEFVLCAFGAAYLAFDYYRAGRRRLAMALAVLSGAFLANVLYVAASRTALVVIPVLMLVLGFRWLGWKGLFALGMAGVLLGAVVWLSSSHTQRRVTGIIQEIEAYETGRQITSAGQRIFYWTNALSFIKAAPVIGHGTGMTRPLFEQVTGGARYWTTANPHNQTLFVGIQLGLVGIAVLFAIWLSHFLLFAGRPGLAAGIGLLVVVQNVVGSLFNSHLFDFTQGWIYVFGVGVAGGMMLRRQRKSGADSQRPV